jgi:hypothetical protein
MQIDGLTADEVSAIESQGAYLAKVDAASAATENAAAADAFAHASLDYALAKARHDELVEQNPNASQDDFPAPVAPVPPVPRVAMTAHECAMSLVRSALDNIIEASRARAAAESRVARIESDPDAVFADLSKGDKVRALQAVVE